MRNLIGDSHWLSDGSHKEFLLSNLLRRVLPLGVTASRGFIIAATDHRACSKELDILLLDILHQGPLFDENDLVIGTPNQALAAISVKTRFGTSELSSVLENLWSAKDIALMDDPGIDVWTGGFFYYAGPEQGASVNNQTVVEKVKTAINEHVHHMEGGERARLGPNMLSIGTDLIIQIEYDSKGEPNIHAYSCNKLAFGAFITGVLDHVSSKRTRQAHPLVKDLAELHFIEVHPAN